MTSVADVYKTTDQIMDLKINPKNSSQLVYPYQFLRTVPNSSRRSVRVFNFPDGDWNRRNQVILPSTDLHITEMYVEFELSAETNQSGPFWQPTPTWLDPYQGASILYKNREIYNLTESECLMTTILDEKDHQFQSKSRLYAFNREAGEANTAVKIYLPLNQLCDQVLQHVGAISAYESGSWSVQVSLRPQLEVIAAVGQLTPTSSMTAMRLICVGDRVPIPEIMLQKQSLISEGGGIVWHFLKSNHYRTTEPVVNIGNTHTVTQTFSSITGNLAHVRMVSRNTSEYTTTDSSNKNNTDYDASFYYGPNNTITVGYTGNKYFCFGQSVYPQFVSTIFGANLGNKRYMNIADVPNVAGQDSTIVDIKFAESNQTMKTGVSSGSLPVDQNLVISKKIAPDTNNTTAHILDTVIYQYATGVINSKTVNINLSS